MSTYAASIEVDVPVDVAYQHWTRVPMFPASIDDGVTRLGNRRYRRVTRIVGVQRDFDSTVREHLPGEKVGWTSVPDLPQEGAVTFEPPAPERSVVTVTLDIEPSTMVDEIAERGLIRRRLQASLEALSSALLPREAAV